MHWNYTPLPAAEVEALGRSAGVSPVLAELLLRLNLPEAGAVEKFLRPALAGLADPFLLQNIDAAVARLRTALVNGEGIVVLGDYDVDGVTSTALLVSILRRFGANPRFIVPRRMEDGYGLSRSAIDRALEPGRPRLFIALDCGTNSHEEIAYLYGQGIDVLVIDHHRSKERPPGQGLLVNPHVNACADGSDAAWRHLCTVGLVFKLAHGLLKQLRAENDPVALGIKLSDYLDLVALGTVADLVPLTGENRILACHGLKILQGTARPGLRALMQVAGVKTTQEILPVDISYRLGPRINASGRLADAALSVELMLSEDEKFCTDTAQALNAFNRERQDIERAITEEAERIIEKNFADTPGVVLFGENWHPGVVGIVAGRVSRKYHRPCIVLGNEAGLAKGSGRSVDGINLVEILGTCDEHLTSWGGHPMAIGISLPQEKIGAFRAQFAEAVRTGGGGQLAEPRLEIAAWLTPVEVNAPFMDELAVMHPYGQGNPEPVFGLRHVVLSAPPEVFKEHHFRFQLSPAPGRRLQGVAWKMARRLPPAGVPLDLAVELAWNYFNGRKLLQLTLVDWRPALKAEGLNFRPPHPDF
ncbi:MAG TPA: single-stranded-DNA-specific exonuclease RecJ [Opitutaceae bacterium]|nr:single-stranded-DNA-specific exonuclease RecJ [Opitutaceae bacterium]